MCLYHIVQQRGSCKTTKMSKLILIMTVLVAVTLCQDDFTPFLKAMEKLLKNDQRKRNMIQTQLDKLKESVAAIENSGGVPGPPGRRGKAGATGSTGMGADGKPGRTGATGSTGPHGRTGSTGQTGNKGRTGSTGSDGPIGSTGATGTAGRDAVPAKK